MADKQRILRDAVPVLVQRLVTPACVNAEGEPTGSNTASGACPRASEDELAAIRAIHIRILPSSRGDMGTGECAGEVVELAQFGLADAERQVFEGQLALEAGDIANAGALGYRAMSAAAQALARIRHRRVVR